MEERPPVALGPEAWLLPAMIRSTPANRRKIHHSGS